MIILVKTTGLWKRAKNIYTFSSLHHIQQEVNIYFNKEINTYKSQLCSFGQVEYITLIQ